MQKSLKYRDEYHVQAYYYGQWETLERFESYDKANYRKHQMEKSFPQIRVQSVRVYL